MYDIIKFEEGYRSKPYYCSERYPTCGYGTKLGPKGADLSNYAIVFTKEIAEAFLRNSVKNCAVHVKDTFSTIFIEAARFDVLVSMCYQLGTTGFDKFEKMIAAIHRKDWEAAAKEALDSKWARQTPERAKRHARVLAEGTMNAYKDLL